jgi:hypothetical protein
MLRFSSSFFPQKYFDVWSEDDINLSRGVWMENGVFWFSDLDTKATDMMDVYTEVAIDQLKSREGLLNPFFMLLSYEVKCKANPLSQLFGAFIKNIGKKIVLKLILNSNV